MEKGRRTIAQPLAELPDAVIASVTRAWPDQAAETLPLIKHNLDHYYFERWGMYVGIEYDGYIHT